LKDWNETLANHITNKTNDFVYDIIDFNDTIYTNQTGKFRYRSKQGYNYNFLTYYYDLNAIIVRLLKLKKASKLLLVLKEIHSYLVARDFKPQYQILDNEASITVTNFLKASNINF